MNPETLLDQIAERLNAEAEKGPGTIILTFKDDFSVIRLTELIPPETELLQKFDATQLTKGLSPSAWSRLGRTLWRCWSSKADKPPTLKLPTVKGPKHGKTTGDTDDSGGRKPA